MRWSGRVNEEKGAVLVLVAILLVVLIGMAALAIDIGQMYIAKQRGQNVCDAAALAGIVQLAMNRDNIVQAKMLAEEAAVNCAGANNEVLNSWQVQDFMADFPDSTLEPVQDDAGNDITVAAGDAIRTRGNVNVDFGFARILGFESKLVGADAVAAIMALNSVSSAKLIPMATSARTIFGDPNVDPPWPEMTFGDPMPELHVRWKDNNDTEFLGPGSFGCLLFDGDKVQDFSDRLAGTKDDDVEISVPMLADTLPGNRNPQVYTFGLKERMDAVYANEPLFADDDTAWDNWQASRDADTGLYLDTGRIVIVPITQDTTNGKGEVQIIGFVGFFIESVVKQGNEVFMTGRFIQGVAIGDDIRWVFPSGQPSDTLNMISSVRLIS